MELQNNCEKLKEDRKNLEIELEEAKRETKISKPYLRIEYKENKSIFMYIIMSKTQTKTNTMQKKKLTLKDSLQKWTVVQDDTFYNKLTLEKDYATAGNNHSFRQTKFKLLEILNWNSELRER